MNKPSPIPPSYTVILGLFLSSPQEFSKAQVCKVVSSWAPYCSPLSSLLQNLLFSVCGLTICAAIICTLSAIVCCVQIFSLDLVHMVRDRRPKQTGVVGAEVCARIGPAKHSYRSGF